MTWTRVTCSLPHHFDIMVTLKVYKQIVMMLKVHSVIPHYLSALEACCLVHYIVSISYGTVLPQKNWRKLKWEAESLNSLWFPAQVCGSEPHEAVRLTSSSPKQQALKIWCHSCVKMRGKSPILLISPQIQEVMRAASGVSHANTSQPLTDTGHNTLINHNQLFGHQNGYFPGKCAALSCTLTY